MTAENCIFTHAQIFKLRKQKKSVKLVKLRVDFTGLMGSVTFLEKRLGIYMVDGNWKALLS